MARSIAVAAIGSVGLIGGLVGAGGGLIGCLKAEAELAQAPVKALPRR